MADDLRDSPEPSRAPPAGVDALFGRLLGDIPTAMRELAKELPFWLNLAPSREITWGSVFHHRVTLEAPAVIFEGVVDCTRDARYPPVADAHLLAIIDAFATDRVMDGQLREGVELGELLEVLGRLRQVRDGRLKRVDPDAASAYLEAEVRAQEAVDHERYALSGRIPVSFDVYEATSFAKQASAFPACLAFAHALDGEGQLARRVNAILRGIVLGLQFYDDVLDWEDDLQRGGAWPVCLALHQRQASVDERVHAQGATLTDDVRPFVLSSGVLRLMLMLAGQQFRIAATLAASVGARELRGWADERALHAEDLAEREKSSPGVAIRMHRLRHFFSEVVS